MRRLLGLAIVFALVIIGLAAYEAYMTHQRLKRETAQSVTDQAVPSVAYTQIPDNNDVEVDSREPQREESEKQFLVGEFEQTTSDDVALYETLEEAAEALEGAAEACCSDDDTADATRLTFDGWLRKMREQHGDIPEIDTYEDLSKRASRGEHLNFDDEFRLKELLTFFNPIEANLKAFEEDKEAYYRVKNNPDKWEVLYEDGVTYVLNLEALEQINRAQTIVRQ